MKKKLITGMLCITMAFSLAACGKKDDKPAGPSSKTAEQGGKSASEVRLPKIVIEDYDPSAYVTKLGNYKGIEYKKKDTEATEEEVNEIVKNFLASHPTKVTDREIKKGDTANIDYVGKKDGKEFAGGSGKGYDLGIGSGQFIPGFEDQLIGHKPGETVEVNVTFPKDYHSEELKGAAAVFTVTINHISEPAKELTDELVAKNTEVKTVAEFKEKTKKDITERKEKNAVIEIQGELLNKIVKESEIKSELPKSLNEFYSNEYKNYYNNIAANSGMKLEDFLKSNKMDPAEFEKKTKEFASLLGNQHVIIKKIAKDEKLDISEEEYRKELKESYESSGAAGQVDMAAFEKEVGKERIMDVALTKKVIDFIYNNAKAASK